MPKIGLGHKSTGHRQQLEHGEENSVQKHGLGSQLSQSVEEVSLFFEATTRMSHLQAVPPSPFPFFRILFREECRVPRGSH